MLGDFKQFTKAYMFVNLWKCNEFILTSFCANQNDIDLLALMVSIKIFLHINENHFMFHKATVEKDNFALSTDFPVTYLSHEHSAYKSGTTNVV